MAVKPDGFLRQKFRRQLLEACAMRESGACYAANKECLWMDSYYYSSCTNGMIYQGKRGYEHLGDASDYLALLHACSRNKDLQKGFLLHDEIQRKGLLEECSDVLVCMYARCDCLSKAKELFNMYGSRDVVTWTTLVAGCARNGQDRDALFFFEQMQREGLSPNAVTFACALKACSILRALDKGEDIHDEVIKQGLLENNLVLSTVLIQMYAKCGAVAKARELLDALCTRDVVCWNVLIAAYVELGDFEQALRCFEQMQSEHLCPASVTFVCILKACGSMRAIDKGKQIHDEIVRQGLLDKNIILGTALVDMYAKCGALYRARKVLEELSIRDTIAWTALIVGYSQNGEGAEALSCFEHMKCEGVFPNASTYASILKACGDLGEVGKGEKIHEEVSKQGLIMNDRVLGTALVDMYCKFGHLAKAWQVLRELQLQDVVSWNAIITGYVDHGKSVPALKCFWYMQNEHVPPNEVTFLCALKACGNMGDFNEGKKIHDMIESQGLLTDNTVLGTALIDMYAKCGALSKAKQVLKQLHTRDAVAWTALISGYVEHGEGAKALNCFEQMQLDHLFPNAVTLTNLLKACSSIGAVFEAEKIHDEITKQGLLSHNLDVNTALVNMYANFGAFVKAQRVMRQIPMCSPSWNALMVGYIKHGQCKQALVCFEEMQELGCSPDGASFVCLLHAFGHLGLVEDALMYFMKMSTKFGVNPDLRQYTCLVSILSKAGHIEEAVRLIEMLRSISAEILFDNGLWSALLRTCQNLGDVTAGRWAFELVDSKNLEILP